MDVLISNLNINRWDIWTLFRTLRLISGNTLYPPSSFLGSLPSPPPHHLIPTPLPHTHVLKGGPTSPSTTVDDDIFIFYKTADMERSPV